MKASEIREMSDEEIKAKLTELKQELFNLRFRQATGDLDNPARIRQVKRDVARILTVLNERSKAAR